MALHRDRALPEPLTSCTPLEVDGTATRSTSSVSDDAGTPSLPTPITRGDKGHDKYCTRKCREEYMECLKNLEAQPLAFPDMVKAKDWLKRHEKEVLIGSIILVAGAAFMVSTAGAGVLVLVPLAAL
jgi:hypothetical protein